jgi:hypothetical protein
MDIQKQKKLQDLLKSWISGTIFTSKGFVEHGISRMLAKQYKANGWINSFGHGAFIRSQDNIEWYGALYAIQNQLNQDVHVGAKTALELHGLSHFLSMGRSNIDLLKAPSIVIPKWFVDHSFQEQIRITTCTFLPPKLGMHEMEIEGIPISISSRERAALELLYLTPRFYSFDEIPLILESLGTMITDHLKELLLQCSSEKVKRLILYFGEKQGHNWYNSIRETIEIGTTPLKISPQNGKYIANYNISIPAEYIIRNESEIKF